MHGAMDVIRVEDASAEHWESTWRAHGGRGACMSERHAVTVTRHHGVLLGTLTAFSQGEAGTMLAGAACSPSVILHAVQ